MNTNRYTYTTIWSDADQEFVGLCSEFPRLSWLDADQEKALAGIKRLVEQVVQDMQDTGETRP